LCCQKGSVRQVAWVSSRQLSRPSPSAPQRSGSPREPEGRFSREVSPWPKGLHVPNRTSLGTTPPHTFRVVKPVRMWPRWRSNPSTGETWFLGHLFPTYPVQSHPKLDQWAGGPPRSVAPGCFPQVSHAPKAVQPEYFPAVPSRRPGYAKQTFGWQARLYGGTGRFPRAFEPPCPSTPPGGDASRPVSRLPQSPGASVHGPSDPPGGEPSDPIPFRVPGPFPTPPLGVHACL
jgi:hypothetical protein